MGALYSNLGVIAMYLDDYRAARELNERAIALRREVGDRWAIGVSETNLGMIDLHEGDFATARQHFEASMRLNQEIGDPWMVAICHNNLGNATRGLGDAAAARVHYAASMRAYEEVDDRWALAFLLEDIGVLAAMSGDETRAFEALGAAESLRAAIDSPRSPSLEEELATATAAARATLGAAEVETALDRGRSLDPAEAVDLGLAICAASG